ncbi:flagellar hook-basal body complex protein FliE [Sinomonas sp. JGH33]|uniref:Flagellar hook-basal body complex protein FliE n=1 Tax=Sinomonas terricola TaxID=3110330 RepID=A0ABU5TBS2_9MICC|nr:flagellar hook-basal body complex protein FliE [Sinomonas sp. JGH33]MEA5457144.1 flagellar hook-basal body complex protein FliE [Sinomonas sp. JGH33]
MSVAPISSLGGPLEGYAAQAAQGTPPSFAPGPTTAGGDFAASLAGAVDNLQQLQSTSNQLAVQAVTGNLDDIHKATLAATRAQVTLELAATVRNKGVDAFNEIMRMQG